MSCSPPKKNHKTIILPVLSLSVLRNVLLNVIVSPFFRRASLSRIVLCRPLPNFTNSVLLLARYLSATDFSLRGDDTFNASKVQAPIFLDHGGIGGSNMRSIPHRGLSPKLQCLAPYYNSNHTLRYVLVLHAILSLKHVLGDELKF